MAEDTKFKPGNQLWKRRAFHGAPMKYADKESLWVAACEYFQWAENNPIVEKKLFSYQGELVPGDIERIRAMTAAGLCTYIGIGTSTWAEYKERPDLSEVCMEIERVIYEQKFAGAAADQLNAAIIARDLGLADKTDITSGGKAIKNDWHIHPVTTEKNGES